MHSLPPPAPIWIYQHAFLSPCSPELEKGPKKRVKLHTHENGVNGQNGQNGEIDSDENYIEVRYKCVNTHKHLKPQDDQIKV